MSKHDHNDLVGLHKAEIVVAVALASLSFGAFSKAEKERALAEKLGPGHPAYQQVTTRVPYPEGLGKTFGVSAVVIGAMGIWGLRASRRKD